MSNETLTPFYFYVLVTGGNGGLGFAICSRLIDEFLHTRPSLQSLYLIPTARSESKAASTVARLRSHIAQTARANARALRAPAPALEKEYNERIAIEPEVLDLCSLASVRRGAARITQRLRTLDAKLDVLVANAGIGGWDGIDWWHVAYQSLTSPLTVLSKPEFKTCRVGAVCRPQMVPLAAAAASAVAAASEDKSREQGKGDTDNSEPPLGEVFAANVFGHYMLAHHLSPLLRAHGPDDFVRGRVIWISTLEAYAHALDPEDLMGLKSRLSYESSKRVTDVLALTSETEETRGYVEGFWAATDTQQQQQQQKGSATATTTPTTTTTPKMYVAHPGICQTDIIPLAAWLTYVWLLCMYAMRVLVGDHWQTIRAYSGATAPVWLALADQAALDKMEEREGKSKWGSAVDRTGKERVVRTEVDGWGFGGVVGEERPVTGRWGESVEVTDEARRRFVRLGTECWRKMEEMRMQWETRMGDLEDL